MLREPFGNRFTQGLCQLHLAVGDALADFADHFEHVGVLALMAMQRRKRDFLHPALFGAEMFDRVFDKRVEAGQQFVFG